MSLKDYHRKRHFKKTPEPYGKDRKGKVKSIFVVQKHAASHLHYDFRLELNGVLISWAVPKGPSLDPTVKRLAMHVEDHPIEYANFEGVIPAGQYGGGTVMIWDEGTWVPLDENPNKAYHAGDLNFELHGKKLKGRWKLIRIKNKQAKNDNAWLLFKIKDQYSKSGSQEKITVSHPRSAATKRSLEEIADDVDRVWTAEGEEDKKKVKKTRYPQKPLKINFAEIAGTEKAKLPKIISPELATLVSEPPKGDHWLHEVKWDGYRLIARINKHDIRLLTRHQNDWTDKFSNIQEALRAFKLKEVILDGEVVALDENNKANFQILQNLMQEHEKPYPIVYYVFDLLYVDGYSFHNVPLIERKRVLENYIFAHHSSDEVKYNDHIVGDGEQVFKNACDLGLEGIVSKRINSIYLERRTKDWLKIKCIKRQEFVIVGYSETESSRKYFRSLLLGFYNQHKQLQYCGKVGTGFTEASLREVAKALHKLEQKKCPVDIFPTKISTKNVHWVKPKLVAEVEYFSITDEDILRHPSFKGLRLDKDAKKIAFEIPVDTKKVVSAKKNSQSSKKSKDMAKIEFTNLDRVLYPDQSLTKQDLVDYYEYIADWIMAYICNRPLSIVRCPRGWQEKCFYQKHVNESTPSTIKSIDILEKNKIEPYIYISNFAGLMGLVQMGVLEIHPWGSHNRNIEKPDRIIFDLDPDPKVQWKEVIKCAQVFREFFDYLDLVSFVKTTGGKGLHIVVPIRPYYEWEEIKSITKKIANIIVSLNPEKYLDTMSKAKRSGKIFIDYFRNSRGATAIANYSTRARKNAPVSTPLSWDELSTKIKADSFNLSNIANRLSSLKKDPWEDFFKIKQGITKQLIKKL